MPEAIKASTASTGVTSDVIFSSLSFSEAPATISKHSPLRGLLAI